MSTKSTYDRDVDDTSTAVGQKVANLSQTRLVHMDLVAHVSIDLPEKPAKLTHSLVIHSCGHGLKYTGSRTFYIIHFHPLRHGIRFCRSANSF